MSFIVGESGLGSWLCHPFKDLTGRRYLALSPGLLGGKMGQHLALRTGTLLPWNDKGAYGCSWHLESSKGAGLFDVFFFGVSFMYPCQLFSNHPSPQVKSASSVPHVYPTPRSLQETSVFLFPHTTHEHPLLQQAATRLMLQAASAPSLVLTTPLV